MTIETPILQVEKYAGDGVTKTFGFGFRTFSTADVVVVATDASGVESVLNPESDFYITSNSSGIGGTVTLASALPKNAVLVITRKIPIKQEIDLVNQGEFYAETIETAFDRLTAIAQDMYEQLGRTLVVPITENSTPQQVLENILTVAATANGYAEAAKAVHEDVVVKYDEILEIKDQVEDQAAVFEGALESIENARDDAVGVVAAEGNRVKGEVGDLIATASAIADRVSADATTATTASQAASQSAVQAMSAQYQALQSEQVALRAAQDAAEIAKSAGFGFRFSYSAQEYQEIPLELLTPSALAKVGDHVVNADGAVFQIVSVTDDTFTLGAFITSIAGKQGETGSGLEIRDTFNSESQLPTTGNSGDAYFVGEDLYLWSPSANAWVNKGPIAGGSITGLMTPDPYTYFLYILNGGEPEGGGGSDTPDTDPSYSPVLDTGKLNYLVLA